MDTLKRWLGAPETVGDNVIGALLWAAVIVLVFKFGFGDSWRFALILGAVAAPVSFAIVEVIRRRRAGRA